MKTTFQILISIFFGLTADLAGANPPFPVYGYLGDWNGVTSAQMPWNSLTHVMDAFALPNANGTISKTPNTAIITAAHSNGKKVMLSIGGATSNDANWASSTGATYINTFVANIMNFVAANNYDGVDIDWEFPTAGEKAQFTSLMQKLWSACTSSSDPNWKGSRKELTYFISPGYDICGMDWATIGSYTDYGILGGYDFEALRAGVYFNGPIETTQTFTDCLGMSRPLSVKSTVDRLVALGLAKSKMILALPLYQRPSWQNVEAVVCPGTAGTQFSPEFEVQYNGGSSAVTDTWAFCQKMNWANGYGLAGFGLWEIAYAVPYASCPELSSIWNTLAGGNACLNFLGTPTHSPTRTRSPTATRTPSPAGTPTFTRTRTPSFSPSPIFSPTATPTASRTRTASPTFTPFVAPLNSKLNLETRSWNSADLCGAGTNFWVEFRITNHDSVAVDMADLSVDAWFGPEALGLVWGSLGYSTGSSGSGTVTFALGAGPGCSTGGRLSDQRVRGSFTSTLLQPGDAALFQLSIWRFGAAPFDAGCDDWSQPGLSGSFSDQADFALNENGVRVCEYLNSSSTDPNSGQDPCTGSSNCGPPATPTPSPSPLISSTATPTRTASGTPTASRTPTGTPSRSASPTASLTASPSRTVSASATATRSPTGTRTATGTPTRTATVTASPTGTRSASPSPTGTRSPTQSFSPTATATATGTRTVTGTPTRSATGTPSVSGSPSGTPSASRTASVTTSSSPSATATPSASPTGTLSGSPTRSATASVTATSSQSASATQTVSGTPLPSRTATATVTLSATPMASPTTTASASPTLTRSPSASSSPSVSPSASSSVTVTPSATPSATASPTRTFSVTATGDASASVTPSASLTPTETVFASQTPSPTLSNSATATLTSSSSATATLSPSGTLTPSFSVTETPGASPSASSTVTTSPVDTATTTPTDTAAVTSTDTTTSTPTHTAAATQTHTATATPTDTAPATPTGTATVTPTNTAPATPTGTATATPTNTAPATPTGTSTASATNTAAATSTDTATLTASPSQTAISTVTDSPSSTRTPTPSASPSATLTASETPLAPATPTATPTMSPAVTTVPSDGTLIIEAAVVMPVPIWVQGAAPQIRVRLSGAATALRWKLYTRSLVLVGQSQVSQALSPHWNALPLELPSDLASDAYYLELVAQRDNVVSKPRLVKLMVLR